MGATLRRQLWCAGGGAKPNRSRTRAASYTGLVLLVRAALGSTVPKTFVAQRAAESKQKPDEKDKVTFVDIYLYIIFNVKL